MLGKIINKLFGCRHKNQSRVWYDRKLDLFYVTCTDCGWELLYDWEEMKVCATVK